MQFAGGNQSFKVKLKNTINLQRQT